MNAATHKVEGNAKVPLLYMALELSNQTRRRAFGRDFGTSDGQRVMVAAISSDPTVVPTS
jgi:hypothetical protein